MRGVYGHSTRHVRGLVVRRLTILTLSLITLCIVVTTSPVSATMPSKGESPKSTSSGWVKDTTHDLDIFAPDAASVYYLDGYGTANGAKTVISGEVPEARYWSFTTYPGKAEIHDTEIAAPNDRYQVTLATSCARIIGPCLATGRNTAGVVVLRLYVPVDLKRSGSGGVPLPQIRYQSAEGGGASLAQASESQTVVDQMAALRVKQGTLPKALTISRSPAPPVPTPADYPAPQATLGGSGAYSNPDNHYEDVPLDTARGDLVVSARAPAVQAGSSTARYDAEHRPTPVADVRYWSLCVDLKGAHTGSCLDNQQVHLGSDDRFTVVVAPTCPVAGYANCLLSGPEALQTELLYRNLLPSTKFLPVEFSGAYALRATYVARANS